MKLDYSRCTDPGKRENNEDSLGIKAIGSSHLFLVADGLGGHANGEIASRLAVDTIMNDLSGTDIDEDSLIGAVLKASEVIRDANISGHTTVAALWVDGDYAVAVHVGDSRIYQFRDGKILFQSIDHSVVQMAVLVGELEPDAVRHHRDRNKLFRVLGEPNEAPRVDSTELTVRPGDRFLLCSDGFWEPVTEEDMLRTIQETHTAGNWLDAMEQIVLSAQDPRQDNYTAVCVVVK